MNTLDRADAYLTIPPQYGADLGKLWWSSHRDAIERGDGTTLAVADEIRAVLEGALAQPPVPAFAFVLNLLHLMKTGPARFAALHAAFTKTRGVAARGRNVGLLIAELCRDLPNDGHAITAADATTALRLLRQHGEHLRPAKTTEPPLTRFGFEYRIALRLRSFTESDLIHWFTHGCGPGQGEELAKEVESLPVRIAKLLAIASRRSRLVGAASLVPALDAALALPPRGRPPESLPIGGYSDVITRGDPERLLPAQFALDPDEFVRRFAARELLYFQREEPHEAVRPERVVVLDQGARTWGSVRLALAAAALSLARIDAKRCAGVRLFLTSWPEPIPLTDADLNALADKLEASDLTANPNEALTRAINEPDAEPAPRDVILLTHTRTARDSATFSGIQPQPNDRVFALSVDDAGSAELSEWRGGMVSLRAFRVDLEAAEAAKPEGEQLPQPRPRVGNVGEWSGDIEPVPFPFRPGLIAEPLQLAFDDSGEWLVIAGRDGILHGLTFDGRPPEVLPRAYRDEEEGERVLKQIDAILGMYGGVVVCGRMTFADDDEYLVAAYYNRAEKRVSLRFFRSAFNEAKWAAHPELNCITVHTPDGGSFAFDLTTGERYPHGGSKPSAPNSRARMAWDRTEKSSPPYELPVVTKLPGREAAIWSAPFIHFAFKDGFFLRRSPFDRRSITPQRDGKPLLDGANIHRAQFAGDVLALAYTIADERRLLLLRGPEGKVLGDLTHLIRNTFALSPDGRMLARRDIARAVVVSETADPGKPVATASPAALHDSLIVEVTSSLRLTITIGGYEHKFWVEDGALHYQSRWEMHDTPPKNAGNIRHAPTAYDPARFPQTLMSYKWQESWWAVADRFGQVLLYTRKGILTAIFLVRRERAAAWIPGGVFWGDPRLIGGCGRPDAARRIGQAILAAEGG